MEHDTLTSEVKTRISPDQRAALTKLAAHRHLKLSDILREAIRERLAREDGAPAPAVTTHPFGAGGAQ